MADPLNDYLSQRGGVGADPLAALLSERGSVGATYAGEAGRIEAEQRRTAAFGDLRRGIEKAAFPTGPGDVPDLLADPGVLDAYYDAYERGYPGLPSPEQLRGMGLDLPERPGVVRKLGAFLERRGKAMGVGALLGPLALGASGFVGEELHEQAKEEKAQRLFKQLAVPPGGRTVRAPTVLSTGLDVLQTGERQVANLISPPEGAGRLKGAALGLIPPSWANVEPHDVQKLYRGYITKIGGDPDDWKHVGAGLALSLAADPLTWTGVGPARKAVTVIALDQATNIGRRVLAKTVGSGKTLNAMAKVMADEMLESVLKTGGSLDDMRPVLSGVLRQHAGATAVKEFDALGAAWGKTGVRVGLPFTEGREVVSAQQLGKYVVEPAKRIWGVAETLGPEVALPGGERHTLLRHLSRAFSPIAEANLDRGDEGLKVLYARSRALKDPLEHETRVAMKQLVAVAKHLPKAKPDEAERLLGMSTKQMAIFAKHRGEGLVDVARDWTSMVLDMPSRAGLERFRDGTLKVASEITEQDELLEDVARRGYGRALVEGLEFGDDAFEGFHGYVSTALKNEGFAEDAAETIAGDLFSRAARTLPEDLASYRTVMDTVPDRVEAAIGYYKSTTDKLLRIEQRRVNAFAKQASTRASAAGEDPKAAYDSVAKKAVQELDSYYYHVIQNTKAIRRRGAVGAAKGVGATGKPAKHRQFLSIRENWEHNQNPVTDAMVSLGARYQAHIRQRAKWDMIDTVFGDSRWIQPLKTKGTTVAAGWDEVIHPVTGETFAIRREARELLERSLTMHEPGALERMFQGYDAILSRWKGYATHARVSFYNLRNMIDDGWRMTVGGFDWNPATIHMAGQIGMLGRLETIGPIKGVVRKVRKPATSKFGKWYRSQSDALSDSYEATLRRFAAKRVKNKLGDEQSLGDIYAAAAKHGVVDKGFASADLATDMPENVEFSRIWDSADGAWKHFNPLSRQNALLGQNGYFLNATGTTARHAENLRRLILFVDRWKHGDTFELAASSVRKWMFDYKELTEAERRIFRRVAPFYTFLRKNIPAQLHGMVKRPGMYIGVAKAKRGVEAKAESEYGPIGQVADHMDDLHAWRLPYQTAQGSPVLWNPGLAMTDVNVLDVSDEMWDRLTPAIDVGQMLRGRDPRSGREWGPMEEPDVFLRAMIVATHGGQIPDWMQIETDESGAERVVIPASKNRWYQKLLPHFVAYGRLFAPDRADVFERELRPWARFREATGQSTYVLNPVKAETYGAADLLHGGLAVPARQSMGVGRRPAELRQVFK